LVGSIDFDYHFTIFDFAIPFQYRSEAKSRFWQPYM